MPFDRFGGAHLAALGIVAVATAGSIHFARNEGVRPVLRALLIGVLAGGVLTFYVSEAIRGELSRTDFLPFHLSDFAVFLSIFALATMRQRAAELLYFVSISAVLALVTPDVVRGFDEMRTMIFFILHGGTLVTAAALTFGFGLAPARGAVVRALVFLNGYALVAAALNAALGTNFLYLRHKPRQPSPLDWMGEWPWYLVAAELVAAVLFALAYLPFVRRTR